MKNIKRQENKKIDLYSVASFRPSALTVKSARFFWQGGGVGNRPLYYPPAKPCTSPCAPLPFLPPRVLLMKSKTS